MIFFTPCRISRRRDTLQKRYLKQANHPYASTRCASNFIMICRVKVCQILVPSHSAGSRQIIFGLYVTFQVQGNSDSDFISLCRSGASERSSWSSDSDSSIASNESLDKENALHTSHQQLNLRWKLLPTI